VLLQYNTTNDRMDSGIEVKRVSLYVNKNTVLPEILPDLTPEETELMISIGCASLVQSKKGLATISNREMIQSMVKEYEAQLQSVEKELFFQKELNQLLKEEQEQQIHKRLAESKDMYDVMLESYRKERELLRDKMADKEMSVKTEAMQIVKRELDGMSKILAEKEKQNQTYRELFEKSIQKVDVLTQKRDVASIGKIGEGKFKELATITFRDFEGFQLKEVCSIGGLGDFHMQFKDLTILVDSKMYTNKVNSTSREKIKRDLINNEHIQFAWLVSMDTYIDRYDKAPFMFEWVNSKKCICYINCLQKQEEPVEILRSVWYCCSAMQRLMTNEDKGELGILKEREMKMRDILSKLSKSNRERDTILSQLRANFDKSDEYIREMLNDETNTLSNYYSVVMEWWKNAMEESPGSTEKIKSTALWNQCKKDMGDKLGDLDCHSFKEVLCSLLSVKNVIKGKTKGAAFEIVGYIPKD